MSAIIKQDNVYVVVNDTKNIREDIDPKTDNSVIIFYNGKDDARNKTREYLFGGRVWILSSNGFDLFMFIDGIYISNFYQRSDNYCIEKTSLNLDKAAAFLNQMENLGVDTFLSNYKTQFQTFKHEVEVMVEKLEQEQTVQYDEKKVDRLKKLRDFLCELSCEAFLLFVNMNAGLENQDYINAYDTVMSLYF